MWADRIVVDPPLFCQNLRFLQRVEQLAVQELRAHFAIERFDITVFPGGAGLNVEWLNLQGLQREWLVIAIVTLALAMAAVPFIGGEFIPVLEEGNIWMRTTFPVDISFEQAARLVTDIRGIFQQFPEVISAASQLGRPDDGTDPTSFFNAEFLVTLKPFKEWRADVPTQKALVEQIE